MKRRRRLPMLKHLRARGQSLWRYSCRVDISTMPAGIKTHRGKNGRFFSDTAKKFRNLITKIAKETKETILFALLSVTPTRACVSGGFAV
jgi:hypothetical protein